MALLPGRSRAQRWQSRRPAWRDARCSQKARSPTGRAVADFQPVLQPHARTVDEHATYRQWNGDGSKPLWQYERHTGPTAIAPRPDVDSARLLCACSCSCLSRRSSPSSYATKLRPLGKYSHKPRLDEHEMCPTDWVLAPTLTNRRLGHRHAIERLDQIVCNGWGSPMHDRFCVLRPLLPLEKVNGTLRTSTPEP